MTLNELIEKLEELKIHNGLDGDKIIVQSRYFKAGGCGVESYISENINIFVIDNTIVIEGDKE